ncbi:MAG: phosphoribosylamine--glycine ligase [Candidatus Rokubacteria bacterium]|nr:phosphoribosylamine--glycine ligase [Candidatus Rokubacteria bacterium]
MNVLLVGSGGREDALAWRIRQSPLVERLLAAPGNPGIARHATCVDVRAADLDGIMALAAAERIDLTVVGPEAPLVAGLADRLEDRGLTVFGPRRQAAAIEGSKAFAKALMARHGIPTARFATFDDATAARRFARELGAPLVVKTDGLAAGKGAIVCATLADADRAIADCLERRAFGLSGATVVIEEFMAGEEASFFVIANGRDAVPLAAAQDHKTIFDDDRGPNTGGMGAYSPAPRVDAAMRDRVMAEIVRPTIAALAKDAEPYRGVLYVGLMLTAAGPRVVEFNCRFGDPECQALVARSGPDWVPLLRAAARGDALDAGAPWTTDWNAGGAADAAVCVSVASGGYPGPYATGVVIDGVERAEQHAGVRVFHAGTARRDGRLVTNGGRVLGVTAVAADLDTAIARAYAAVSEITFDGMHYRRDIGRKALAARRG